MKILVLGGTGAMGKFLVRELVEMGNDVFVTTRSTSYKNISNGKGSVTYIQGDAHDDDFVKNIMAERWDAAVDFMSYSTKEFELRYKFMLDKAGHYIFLSSARVYADSERPITEESPRLLDVCRDKKYLATDEYALAKARQENMLRDYGCTNWTIVRPYITYSDERLQLGVFEKENWLYRALQGRTIVFSKDIADRYTTMTYGGDVARGIAMLTGNKKAFAETFHIAGPQSMKWGDILTVYLDTIEKCTGKRPDVRWIDNMDELEKFMGNHYQVHCDRLYDRRFDSNKLDTVCGKKIEYTPIAEGLETCLSRFIKENEQFRQIGWYAEAYMDKIVGEKCHFSTLLSIKQKLGCCIIRYLPFIVSYAIYRLARNIH